MALVDHCVAMWRRVELYVDYHPFNFSILSFCYGSCVTGGLRTSILLSRFVWEFPVVNVRLSMLMSPICYCICFCNRREASLGEWYVDVMLMYVGKVSSCNFVNNKLACVFFANNSSCSKSS